MLSLQSIRKCPESISLFFLQYQKKIDASLRKQKKSDWMRSRPIGFLFVIDMVLIFQLAHTPLYPVQNLPEVFQRLFHPAFWHTGLPDPCMA